MKLPSKLPKYRISEPCFINYTSQTREQLQYCLLLKQLNIIYKHAYISLLRVLTPTMLSMLFIYGNLEGNTIQWTNNQTKNCIKNKTL
jgi:hypothetical protein